MEHFPGSGYYVNQLLLCFFFTSFTYSFCYQNIEKEYYLMVVTLMRFFFELEYFNVFFFFLEKKKVDFLVQHTFGICGNILTDLTDFNETCHITFVI